MQTVKTCIKLKFGVDTIVPMRYHIIVPMRYHIIVPDRYTQNKPKGKMKMSEYVKQAKDFLASCNATMKIKYLGKEINKMWSENTYRNTYRATIKTPYGTMWVKFWDSIYDTQQGNEPTEYDILACLQKYDVGSLEDFTREFGYDPELHNVNQIYNAVCNEYEKICRCFTEEQIEQMQEIY